MFFKYLYKIKNIKIIKKAVRAPEREPPNSTVRAVSRCTTFRFKQVYNITIIIFKFLVKKNLNFN